jgi:hypothetical protein
MSKYNLGQTLYWFKYNGHQPDLMCFEVGCIKQTKDGYKYSTGLPGALFQHESICFESIKAAVEDACFILKGFLVNENTGTV